MSYIKKVIVLIAFMYWLVPVYLEALPQMLNSSIYYGVPLVYLVLNYRRAKYIFQGLHKKYLYFALGGIIVACIWALCVISYNNSHDYSYLGKIFKTFGFMYVNVFLFMLADKAISKYSQFERYSIFFTGALTACVGFTIVMLLFVDLRISYASLIISDNVDPLLIDNEASITRFSICGFAGYKNTILSSMGVLLSCNLIKKKIYLGYPFLLMLLLGNMFYGRIGVLLSVISLIILMTQSINMVRLVKSVLGICVVVVCLLAIFSYMDNPMFDAWKIWLVQPIESFLIGLQYGQFTLGHSGDMLLDQMYFMPDDKSLLLGDGQYGDENGYYMHTDAGYMRIVLFFGIVGAFIIYGTYYMLFLFSISNIGTNKTLKCICYLMVLLFFIEEIKGDAYPIFFGLMSVLSLGSKQKEYYA